MASNESKEVMQEAIKTQQAPETENKVLTMSASTIIKGLIELGSLQIEDFDLNMKITEAAGKLGVVEKAYLKTASVLIQKHIETNEKGVPLTQGEGAYRSYVYKSISDKETYLKEMGILNNTPVNSIEVGIIKMSQLQKLKGLTAYTMMKLGVLVHNDLKEQKKDQGKK